MKHLLSVLLLSLAAFAPVFGQSVQDSIPFDGPLTLEECLEYAYENNQTLQNSALEQSIAKADVGVTKAQGLPQVDGSVSYSNNFAIQRQFLPDFISPSVYGVLLQEGVLPEGTQVPEPGIFAAAFGVRHSGNAGISLSQMIFDGSYFVGLRAANTYADLMQKNYDQTKIELTEQVTKAYYSVLVSEERKKIVSSNFNRLDTLLNETRLMYENGLAEKIDVDRIAVQFNNAKTEKSKVDRTAEVSALLLKFQMGMPIEQDMELADQISDIDMDLETTEEQNFAYSDRISFAQNQINQDLVKLDLRNNRIQYLPKLTANASIGYNTGVSNFGDITNFSDQWFQYGSFGASLNIPIFDGLRKHKLIQKSKLQLQQLENQNRLLKNNIDLEIVQAKVNLQNSVESLEAQRQNLDLAQEVFNVSKIKYQEGVGSNLEVITAQADLQTAETNYFSALYDALIAKVDLKKAFGDLIPE